MGKLILTERGYIRIWSSEEKRLVMEHRHVLEQALGRKLTADERVHHINGDRTDNRVSNLTVYSTQAEHLHVGHGEDWSESRKKYRMAICHPDKPHRAFGLCVRCYSREYWRRRHPGSKAYKPRASSDMNS